MSIVLVTGSCGLVGSEASAFFSEKGFDIIGIDNNSRKLFFGKDGDVSWVRRKLEKNIRGPFEMNEFSIITVILQEYLYIAFNKLDFFL